jgi:serine/threonine protein kinase
MDASIFISSTQYAQFEKNLSRIVDESLVIEPSIEGYSETPIDSKDWVKQVFWDASLDKFGPNLQKIFFMRPRILGAFACQVMNKIEASLFEHHICVTKHLSQSKKILQYVALQCLDIPYAPRYLFSKWCSEGSLEKYMSAQLLQFNPYNILERHEFNLLKIDLAKQITEGLFEIHQAGYIHCSLKPSHILLDGKKRLKVYICGFKRSELDGKGLSIPVQSWHYSPPESWANNIAICKATDLWALGLVLLELMYGPEANLFKRVSVAPTLEELYEIRKEICEKLPEDGYTILVQKLLSISPSERPETPAVLKELCLFEESPFSRWKKTQ